MQALTRQISSIQGQSHNSRYKEEACHMSWHAHGKGTATAKPGTSPAQFSSPQRLSCPVRQPSSEAQG